MNDLKVIVNQKPAEITFNFDEIKLSLSEQMEAYKAIEVTEEVLTERKKILRLFVKLQKQLMINEKKLKAVICFHMKNLRKRPKNLLK